MSGYAEGILVIMALNIITAYATYLPLSAGQLNLGVAGFMAIGAYSAAFLGNELAWPVAATVAAGAGVAGIVGAVIGYPVLRARGIYLVLATLAFGELVRTGILNLDVVGAAAGYPVKGYVSYWVICLAAVCVVVFVTWLTYTPFGLAMVAVRQDEIAAEQFGVTIRNTKTIAFALGAMLAGLAGALYAHHFSYIEAQRFSVVASVYVAMYVLLGGVQTVAGPLVGAVFFTLLPEVFRVGDTWRFVIFAVVLILTMLWRPEGLIDRDLVEAAKHRLARILRRSRARPT
ncbi:MAG: branched-chain amino acid ABC transporter permease [Pseudorhodoplanes sp.]|uniref:branched-chain amino acid ABC transporter permease n=1 Tax=Pseudorhodoplanes sp. TaxID=1934341 RepID=UPI003D0ECAC4